MENKKVTFNEETYEFNPYFPKGQLAYEVWVNSVEVKEDTPYTLHKVDNQFHLYYNTFFTMVTCSVDLTFDDVVKVISYIRNNK
jgi:hypothetical protein